MRLFFTRSDDFLSLPGHRHLLRNVIRTAVVVERKMPWSTARLIEVSGPHLEKHSEPTRYEHASPTTSSFTHC